MLGMFEQSAEKVLQQEISEIIDWLITFKPPQLMMTPYGDSVGMQLIQKKQFDKVLAMLAEKQITPTKNACNMTFAQMAMMCGASTEQVIEFEKFDSAAGINPETRTSNGGHPSFMIAANQLNLELLKHFVKTSEDHFLWQQTQSYLNRTLVHALYLPSLIKGEHSDDEYLAMTTFFVNEGVRFDIPDGCGYTAIDYALLYYPHLMKTHALLQSNPEQIRARPDRKKVQDFWGMTEIHMAVIKGDVKQLEALIALKASALANGTQQTPLHLLCCKTVSSPEHTIPMAERLMALEAQGICMNQGDINGFLPLHNAASFGMVELFEWLLNIEYHQKKLGDQLPTLLDFNNRTVAHDVCMNGEATNEDCLEIMKMIFTRCGPAIFMQPDRFGIPPVLYAYYCRPFLVPIILRALMISDLSKLDDYVASIIFNPDDLAQPPVLKTMFETLKMALHREKTLIIPFRKFITKQHATEILTHPDDHSDDKKDFIATCTVS